MSDPIENELTITVTGIITSKTIINLEVVVPVGSEPIDPPDPIDPPPIEPPPVLTAGLRAEIVYGGMLFSFDEETGTDLGDYRDPAGQFVQHNIMATSELKSFRVFFRPDEDNTRSEVVFELGDTTVGTKAANMTAYTATIYSGNDVLATVQVPEHHWYSRWRWQSAPRPIVNNVRDLQAEGFLPFFDNTLATNRPLSPVRVYSPMGLAGLTAYIPSTGERDEIGLVTEAQAEYIRGDTGPDSLFAQAEASGTLPWHFRNEDGGAVFDFKAHPQATLYGGPAATIPWIATPITLDVAHEPPLAYLPYLLTRDPYYLEEMQFAATYNVLASNSNSRTNFCIGFALRAHAWALRVLAQCARFTPDDAPSWVQSRAYWQEWLNQEREWMLTRYVNPTAAPFTDLPYQPFHFMQSADNSPASSTIPGGTYISPWMEDYEAAVLCHVVMIGHADWQQIMKWKLANTVARTNGTSGWVRAQTTIYTMVLRETDKSPYAPSWQAVWDLNVKMQPPEFSNFLDPNAIPAGASLTYASYTMSALAMAALLGVEGATDCFIWLTDQIKTNSTGNIYIDRKWSMTAIETA